MSDFNYTGYEQQKRAAYGTYGAKAARNAYAQFLAQQRGSRKKFDIQTAYEKKAPRLIGSYTRRGLAGPSVQSGVFNAGLTDFAKQNVNDLADLASSQAAEMNNLGFEQAQNQADLDAAIARLEYEKQANIANAASTLLAFKPFLT